MPSLYSEVSQRVDPVTNLLKAAVELNHYADTAINSGWTVTLSVSEETGALDVSVSRNEWPTLVEEAA